MTHTIYKYELMITDEQTITVPSANRVLTVRVQDGKLCMWLAVKPTSKKVAALIRVVGTGTPAGPGVFLDAYLGTVQDKIGQVWHVFGNPMAFGGVR